MKKNLVTAFIVIMILVISGCSDQRVEADMPSGFEHLTKDKINNGSVNTIINTETGCYFAMTTGGYDTTVSIAQIFIEKDGVSVPYCK